MILGIVQARMGSTRLPGKVLRQIFGASTVLSFLCRRLERVHSVNHWLVATTTDERDDVIESETQKIGWTCFRGAENDVLDRFYQAARTKGASSIVRITADCPLHCPEVIDQAIKVHLVSQEALPVTNTLKRTYPDGLDTEVLSRTTLDSAWEGSTDPFERAHVTPYVYKHSKALHLMDKENLSHIRLTLDYVEDLEVISAVWHALGENESFTYSDLKKLIRKKPRLFKANQCYVEDQRNEKTI